ncbi:MAG: CRISPR-associated protein Cas4 [Thermotoga sp.]|nr:MAG: CRISPR-associated protein Cas4 [Thermotoga sp.]
MNNRAITGNLINAYFICHRKLWFFAHEINPYLNNTYLEIGTLIGEQFYKREKKEIQTENMKIDLVKKENGNIVVGEIKKSSIGRKSATMQLLFYLYQLKKNGIEAKGELLIPKERKKESVILTAEAEKELEEAFAEIQRIISLPIPPPLHKTRFCRACAYKDFCFA